ncbi:hypothetical protein ACIHAX_35560 [Nocardia sp. NPDC051929]
MSERHLAVQFTPAGLVLHYRAEKAAAEEFATGQATVSTLVEMFKER